MEAMSQTAELDPLLVRPLRRPERRRPRRRPRSPVRARPAVVRAAVLIALAGLVFAFAGRIGGVALEPVLATYRTGREIRRLEAVLAREQAVNAQLRADIAYLRTRDGVEQEARRRGWVRSGEVALTVIDPQEENAASPSGASGQPGLEEAKPRSVAGRIRAAIETCLAVFGHPRPEPSSHPRR